MSIIENIKERIRNILMEDESRGGKGSIDVRIYRIDKIRFIILDFNGGYGEVLVNNMGVSVKVNNKTIYNKDNVNVAEFAFNFRNPKVNLGLFVIEENKMSVNYKGYVEINERGNGFFTVNIRGTD